ncbi:uncharacterized protein LOC119735850 [Patiria miniata]|uniref:Uncharacterized protein n=1 Tax=Patiria miniata TaxID=46514 RepID=A0A914AQM9_PATMI|nr:uncharacterized protein LOC119735850 [Patiria miniata]
MGRFKSSYKNALISQYVTYLIYTGVAYAMQNPQYNGTPGTFAITSQRIEEDVIVKMTNDELSEYIPRKGDRVVVKAFARKEKSRTQAEKRKSTLLESLGSKVASKSGKKEPKLLSDTEDESDGCAPGPSDDGRKNNTHKAAETKKGHKSTQAKSASKS